MKNTIITISREFGCGARIIGKKLAVSLGFLYYDKELIQMAASKSGLSPDFIETVEQRASSSFLYNLASAAVTSSGTYTQYDVPINDKAFFAQAEVIKEVAAKGNCIIVGRCADYVLRNNPDCFKVFLYGDREQRVKLAISEYGLDPKSADRSMTRTDKGRANYYKFYTGRSWGDLHNYDLAVDTFTCGIDGAVDILRSFVTEVRKAHAEEK